MKPIKRLYTMVAAALMVAAAATAARAQEAGPSPAPAATPMPSATDRPTFMDVQYDGRTHFTLAPYLWGPSVKGDFQYSVPTLQQKRGGHGGSLVLQKTVQIGPSDYLPKLNSAFMFAFDLRKGAADIFGDAIYLNASTSSTVVGTVGGPLGKVNIPFTVDANAHLTTAIWEAAAGYSVAHGHNADLSAFAGIRQFPVNLNISYTATVGKRGILAPSGGTTTSELTSDLIFGFRGKAFFGDDRWFVPYYIDLGTGLTINNQTWEGYTGAGYAFEHGQTLLLAYRTLNYNAFPPNAHVQKLSLGGPLLGYTFNL